MLTNFQKWCVQSRSGKGVINNPYCCKRVEPKYPENAKLCYMDKDNFIIHIKTKDVYEDIAVDVEKRFDTLNYEINRSLPIKKNKKVIGLMKDELGEKL